MSKTKQILEISSPKSGAYREEITGSPMECAKCGGMGWTWTLDSGFYRERKECPLCNGTGYVKPKITIEWEPTK